MNKSLRRIIGSVIAVIMIVTSSFSGAVMTFAADNTSVDDRGDIDGRNGVDVNDAAILLSYVLNKTNYNGSLSKEMLEYMGDVNCDGLISSSDVSEILRKALEQDDYSFSGAKPERPTEGSTSSEIITTEVTTVSKPDTTEVTTAEPTTEEPVTGEPQDAIYEGYDIVVDGRANTDADREGQPIFKTVREAVASITEGGSEEKPVVVGIVPGVYREPVRVNKPWITFKKITNSTSIEEDATLTWYWLTNYTYDNIGADGDVDMSMPNKDGKYTEKMPNWGRSTWIQGGATGFKAIGIYFENSANLYMTQEELDANVRPVDSHPQRNVLKPGNGDSPETDVRANQWIERGCALYTEADKVVFENCKVISTQDTIGTAGRAYFKDCFLAGQVDFICGGGQILFENCDIHWQSSPWPDEEGGGHLTAASTGAYPEKGYLFYNCKVTGEDTAKPCDLGRPWSGKNTETIWVNTIAYPSRAKSAKDKPMICDEGWASMGGVEPKDARGFFEYGSKDINGKLLDTSKRKGTTNERFTGGVLDEFTVVKYNPYRYTAFNTVKEKDAGGNDVLVVKYDGWDPAGVVEKWQEIESKQEEITLNESYIENFKLPEAPAGYEIQYYIKNNFAEIDKDGRTVKVTRPVYGQPDAVLEFTAHLKKAGTIDGVEFIVSTKVLARTDKTGTFDTNGTITIDFPQENDLNINLSFDMPSGFHAKDVAVILPAGATSVEYVAEALPASEYNVTVTMDNNLVSVKGGEVKNFTGVVNVTQTLNIDLGILETMNGSAGDLKGTASSGYTMEKFNDGERGEVYHFKKNANASAVSAKGFVWDLAALASNIDDLKTADQVRINFSVRVPSADGWSGNLNNYFDITGADTKDFAAVADNTRYLRFRLGGNWQQFDVHSNTVGGFSGSSTNSVQKLNLFGKFSKEKNKNQWCDIAVTLDYKNEKIVIKATGKEASSTNEFTGENGIPSAIDRGKLNFVIYPQDSTTIATNEYYITKPEIAYERFIPQPDTKDGINVSGSASGISKVILADMAQKYYKYSATASADGKIDFGKIPKGKYEITVEGNITGVTGTGVSSEGGKYYITVGDTAVTDLSVTGAERTPEGDLKEYFDTNFTKSADDVYTVDKAIVVPESTKYEISIKEDTASVKKDGTLVRGEFGSEATTCEVTFTIKNTGDETGKDVVYKVLVEPKSAKEFYDDFEDKAVDTSVPANSGFAGKIVNVEGRGNVLEFSNIKTDGTQADGGVLTIAKVPDMAADGVYAISFDFMKDDVSDRGWRMQFGNYVDLLYNQGNVNVDTGGSVKDCGGYTDADVYGKSVNTLSGGKGGQWYSLTVVSNNKNAHVDVYLDGKYVTSYKGVAGQLPNQVIYQSYWGKDHSAKIYADNVKVVRLDEGFADVFTDVDIPAEVGANDIEKTVPVSTEDGKKIVWSADKGDDIVTIDNTTGKITLKAQQSGTNTKISAFVTDPTLKTEYPGCANAGVVETISYTKTYDVKFNQNSTESFEVSGKVKFDFAPESDVTVKVAVVQNGEEKGFAEFVVGAGTTEKAYTIENLVPGEYTVTAEIVTEGTKNVIKEITPESITGADGDTVSVDVAVGETETKTFKVDFDTVNTMPEQLTNGQEGMTLSTMTEGEGNNYLQLSVAGGVSDAERVGAGYDLYSLITDESLKEVAKNADTVTVSYRFKITGYDSGNYSSYFDIADGYHGNQGQSYAYDKRIVNLRAGRDNQVNIGSYGKEENIAQMGNGNSGSLKFTDAANTGKWYNVNLIIDYKNKTVTGTVGVGENVAALVFEGGSQTGTNGLYPAITGDKFNAAITRDNLKFAYYPRKGTAVACLDDLAISFEALKTEASAAGYSVRGTVDEGIAGIQLQSVGGDSVSSYNADINDSSFELAGVPSGEYNVVIETAVGSDVSSVSGLSGSEDGYKIIVNNDVDGVDIFTGG